MPQPAPQPPAPEPEPSPRPGGAPPAAPDEGTPKPGNRALFHTLLEAGFDSPIAYTAEQRIRTMTSGIVATRVEPLAAEIRRLREDMATMREEMATKADLATVESNLRREISDRDARLVKWFTGMLMAQAALIVALLKLLP